MTKSTEPIIIKKYANRRLYNTGSSTYVTLENLAEMVKAGDDFVVFDAKSGEDITRSVLTQIIFEQESKGENLLPIAFLRQLIRFYDDSLKSMVPSYLEFSLDMLTREQDRLRQQVSDSFGTKAFQAMEEQARQNMAIFDKTMRMFSPFPRDEAADPPMAGNNNSNSVDDDGNRELESLKRQMEEMRLRLDRLSGEGGGEQV